MPHRSKPLTLALALAVATALGTAALSLTGGAAAALPAPPDPGGATRDEVKVATFNVLGHSHGARRSGESRIRGALRHLDEHEVGVVGFQELEDPQYAAFRRAAGDDWGVVTAPSRNGKDRDPRNSVGYRTSQLRLVSADSLAIPYFYGRTVHVPVVTLASRTTGAQFTIVNTHNASDVHGGAQRYRTEATRRQVRLVERLRDEGRTVFMVGDMNERRRYFCAMTRSGSMHAASGGSTGRPCRDPERNGIDWIFGSRDVGFSGWTSDSSTRRTGVSDHPIVVAKATIPV